jgi:hypothetical protein
MPRKPTRATPQIVERLLPLYELSDQQCKALRRKIRGLRAEQNGLRDDIPAKLEAYRKKLIELANEKSRAIDIKIGGMLMLRQSRRYLLARKVAREVNNKKDYDLDGRLALADRVIDINSQTREPRIIEQEEYDQAKES